MKPKKLLSITLALLMAFSLCPYGEFLTSVSAAASATAAVSGTTGDCTWALDGTKLTVSGKGKMKDYQEGIWSDYGIETLVIENGVTSIGARAFKDCSSLKSITIPNSVTSIGESAFKNCTSLESITIPDGVTSIANYAFIDCEKLKSITVPDSITSMGDMAFSRTAYYDNTSNWENGVLYIGKHLIRTDNETVLGDYTIKDGTITIACHAFEYCLSLESITIPDSVKSIGDYAFCLSSSFESITIPKSVTSIGIGSLGGCDDLTAITVQEGNTVYHSSGNCIIETKSKTLIQACNSSVIPSDGSITSIADAAFMYCKTIESIAIPDSVKSIGVSAFFNCSNLESITIPSSVTSIADWAFDYCSDNLTIYGKYGTAVAEYAKNFDIKFVDKSHTSCTTFNIDREKATFTSNGTIVKTCSVCEEPISETIIAKVSDVKLSKTTYTYDGKAKKPTVTAKDSNGKVLKLNTDYTVSYSNNTKAGKASVKVTLKGNYSGTKTLNFTIKAKKITPTISGYSAKVYNGKAQTQNLTVKYGKTTLKKGTDYTVTYSNNKYVGKASVKVTLKGNYSGSKTLTFKINPKSTSLKSVTAGKKQITAKWNKQATQTTGYQIQYSTSANFKNAKTVTVTSNKTTSKIFKNLSGGKKYYVRVRTYKTVKNTKYYSAWSAKKSATAKK